MHITNSPIFVYSFHLNNSVPTLTVCDFLTLLLKTHICTYHSHTVEFEAHTYIYTYANSYALLRYNNLNARVYLHTTFSFQKYFIFSFFRTNKNLFTWPHVSLIKIINSMYKGYVHIPLINFISTPLISVQISIIQNDKNRPNKNK